MGFLWYNVLVKMCILECGDIFMIKHNNEMTANVKVNMRGGDGQAVVTEILTKEEYKGKARLVGTILLEPGCSIGEHIHENEEEIFYIIDGVATYNDNGNETKLSKGDSCICYGGEKHSVANREKEGNLTLFAVILTY